MPAWVFRALIVISVAGFPVAAALAWIYDVSGRRIRRSGEAAAEPVEALGIRLIRVFFAVAAHLSDHTARRSTVARCFCPIKEGRGP